MKQPIRFILWSVFSLFLFACASAPDVVLQVQPGMTREQVQKAMGNPTDRTFRGKQESWVYEKKGEASKLVVFERGKVVEMLNAKEGEKVLHEVTKKDVDPDTEKSERCEGSNQFGKYPEGGGCNLYGCYPRGGYCNGFGCSASGRCTVDGCPKKIKSYQCRD